MQLDEEYIKIFEPHQQEWLRARQEDGTITGSATGLPYVTRKGWEFILQVGGWSFPEGSDPLDIDFVKQARGDGEIAALMDATAFMEGVMFVQSLSELEEG